MSSGSGPWDKLLRDRANLLSKIRGEMCILRVWRFFSLLAGLWSNVKKAWFQQKAGKGLGFAGELLQVEKWQNQNLSSGFLVVFWFSKPELQFWQNQNLRHSKVREEGKRKRAACNPSDYKSSYTASCPHTISTCTEHGVLCLGSPPALLGADFMAHHWHISWPTTFTPAAWLCCAAPAQERGHERG